MPPPVHPYHSLLRNTSNWTYNTPITIAAQSQWQYINVTIPPPVNGSSWNLNSNIGAVEVFIAPYNSSGMSSSPNTWLNTSAIGLTTNTNIVSATGGYVEFTGVQFEKGTIATPFEFRP